MPVNHDVTTHEFVQDDETTVRVRIDEFGGLHVEIGDESTSLSPVGGQPGALTTVDVARLILRRRDPEEWL